jgi:hypothetical protein
MAYPRLKLHNSELKVLLPSWISDTKVSTSVRRSKNFAFKFPFSCSISHFFSESLNLCTQFMHTIYALNLCTQFMHTIYALNLCTQFMHTIYALNLCTQSMHSIYALNLCTQFMHTIYAHNLCTQFMHIIYPLHHHTCVKIKTVT